MVDKCMDCMKKGKAGGIDRLTVEHVIYSDAALVSTVCGDYARFVNEMHPCDDAVSVNCWIDLTINYVSKRLIHCNRLIIAALLTVQFSLSLC